MGNRLDSVYYIKEDVSMLNNIFGSVICLNVRKKMCACSRATVLNGNNVKSRCLSKESDVKEGLISFNSGS